MRNFHCPSAQWSGLNWSSPFFQGSQDTEHPRLISRLIPENQGDSLSPVGWFPTLLHYQNKILGWPQFCPSISGSFYRKTQTFWPHSYPLMSLLHRHFLISITTRTNKNPPPCMLTAAKLWEKPQDYLLLITYIIPQDFWLSHHRKHCQE